MILSQNEAVPIKVDTEMYVHMHEL